ncbi:MAG: molybdopterin molybdotransferase MoeA [Rubritalea sp.]|uniref:molybdopterin molybdotransferase MoeA n=1 Tax=Rubritalea sp. TaxID=2109375 RepID=UPI0032420574
MKPLTTPADAIQLIESNLPAAAEVTITLDQAFGKLLRRPVIADRNIPPFDRAMMDGIAIHSSAQRGSLTIEAVQAAGLPALTLQSTNACLEVMTGAPVPIGCDCVVPIEEVTMTNGQATISAEYSYAPGNFIHKEASEHLAGDIMLEAGTELGAAELAIAASCGASTLYVSRTPQIHLITSGDEVIPPEGTPEPFQIRASHPIAIQSAIHSENLGTVTHTHIPDDELATRDALQHSIATADILILTGGVSKGKFDYIAPLLNEIASAAVFHGISQRPGKPFAYFESPIPIFALPGNPLSVMACLARYVLPALKFHLGIPNGVKNLPLSTLAPLHPKLTQLLAGRIEDGIIYPSSPKNSGDYAAVLGCHGVIEIPSSTTARPAGAHYNFYPWAQI